jgi:hypothetical protein
VIQDSVKTTRASLEVELVMPRAAVNSASSTVLTAGARLFDLLGLEGARIIPVTVPCDDNA